MQTNRTPEFLPSNDAILAAFRDEIVSLGGTVTDHYETPELVLVRAVLPADAEVRPGDAVRGGVALRAAGPDILVHPYTFRQVCSNGAIAAHATETRRVERVATDDGFASGYEVAVATAALRDAVRASAAPAAFATVVDEMRSMTEIDADFAIHLLPMLARIPNHFTAHVVTHLLRRFTAQPDRSLFGLLNSVTALARDTHDADLRWRLEELGGAMGALVPVAPRLLTPEAALVGA